MFGSTQIGPTALKVYLHPPFTSLNAQLFLFKLGSIASVLYYSVDCLKFLNDAAEIICKDGDDIVKDAVVYSVY